MQVVRGRGSRATDGALRPTPTAPRQVGLIPPGPCQAASKLHCLQTELTPGLAFLLGTHTPESFLREDPCPSPSPTVPSGIPSRIHVSLGEPP